ncbi:MAG: peptidase dimerization domain protein, partial [Bacteroidetes bacterium]|nr:peptidase dimerization domain protein [Bacteroidota bacterium]
MKSAKPYIAQHKDRFIDELLSLLKIPSISADKAYAKDVIRTADVIKSSLEK